MIILLFEEDLVQRSEVRSQGVIRILDVTRAVDPAVLVDARNGSQKVRDPAVDEVFSAVVKTITVLYLVFLREESLCRFKVFARPARRFVSVDDLVGRRDPPPETREASTFLPTSFF